MSPWQTKPSISQSQGITSKAGQGKWSQVCSPGSCPLTPEGQSLSTHRAPLHSAPSQHPRTAPRAALVEEPTPTAPQTAYNTLSWIWLRNCLGLGWLENYPYGGKAIWHQTRQKNNPRRKISYMGNMMTSSSTLIKYLLNMKQGMLFLSCFLHFPWS